MAKHSQCPDCGTRDFKRIGVPGIKKCHHCGTLVDLRRTPWWRKLLSTGRKALRATYATSKTRSVANYR